MRTNLTLASDQFAFLASVVRYRGNAVQPHGERFVWRDSVTPRTDAPVRFLYVKAPFPGVRASSVAVRFAR